MFEHLQVSVSVPKRKIPSSLLFPFLVCHPPTESEYPCSLSIEQRPPPTCTWRHIKTSTRYSLNCNLWFGLYVVDDYHRTDQWIQTRIVEQCLAFRCNRSQAWFIWTTISVVTCIINAKGMPEFKTESIPYNNLATKQLKTYQQNAIPQWNEKNESNDTPTILPIPISLLFIHPYIPNPQPPCIVNLKNPPQNNPQPNSSPNTDPRNLHNGDFVTRARGTG